VCFPFRLATGEAISATRQFLDGMAFLQFREHFEQWSSFGLLKVKSLSDFTGGGGFAPNLKKTQYVIGTEL
jgi:hypothetical protein